MVLSSIGKIKQDTLSDLVENKVRKYIINAKLHPGDSLPSEKELADTLGVSRNIVREALSRLRMLGVVESRKRRGLILTEPEVFKGLETVFELPVLSEKKRKELFELRVFIELGMASQVFRNMNEDALKRLDAIVEQENSGKALDVQTKVDLDVQFHSVLYEVSANDTLSNFQALLKPFITEHTSSYFAKKEESIKSTKHKDILCTLRSGKEEDFIECMRKHLSHFLD